jgi:type VII secretion integral membrane protein EccD
MSDYTITSTAGTAGAQAVTPAQAGEVCRLTICGPASRVELAVPAHVPVADLMPTVLGYLDPSLATTGLGHGGWVLQRLGEAPLAEDQGTAAAGLYDGDILYLRPRDDQLPVADFDDLVDGVHTGLSGRSDTWRPALTRWVCLGVAGLCGLLAILAVASGGAGPAAVVGAAVIGTLLIGGGTVLARVFDDAVGALTLGVFGVLAFGVAGLALPPGTGESLSWPGGPGVLAAVVGVAAGATVARAALGHGGPELAAVAVGAVLTAVCCATGLLVGFSGAATSAVLVTVVLVLTRAVPKLAAWLGGLVVDPVPTTPGEFQDGLDPLPSKQVIDQATVANQYVTACFVTLGVLLAGGLLVVTTAPTNWDTLTFSLTVPALLLMHARELTATWQRMAVVVPAVGALVSVVLHWSVDLPLLGRLCAGVGLLALAGNAVAGAQVLPGRRLVPKWGRWGDVLHWLCALSVLPVVLSMTGFYHWAATWL